MLDSKMEDGRKCQKFQEPTSEPDRKGNIKNQEVKEEEELKNRKLNRPWVNDSIIK